MREKSIKYWNEEERPREKMKMKGQESLTVAELLAILIHSGHYEKSALDLAYEMLDKVGEDLSRLSQWDLHDFKQIKGIGDAKSVTLKAAFELSRRRSLQEARSQNKIRSTQEAGTFMRSLINDATTECFCVIYLNNAHKILHYEIHSRGGLTSTVIDVRVILKTALQLLSSKIILGHNHPSGSLKPSEADIQLTEKVQKGCEYLDIVMLDHIIVGGNDYVSFADEGWL